jgi:hypothetical protein
VVGTRKSTKRILQETEFAGCDAIVMAADPDRNRLTGDFIWSQEPQRVRRKAKLPVFLVVSDPYPAAARPNVQIPSFARPVDVHVRTMPLPEATSVTNARRR